MLAQATAAAPDPLTDIHAELHRRLDDGAAALAVSLATAAYRRLSSEQLANIPPEQAADRIEQALDYVASGDGVTPLLVVQPHDDTTLVHLHVADGPFVVSTITEELHRLGLDPVDLAHPVFGVERDADGRLQHIGPARHASRRETYLLLDLQAPLDAGSRESVHSHLRDVLDDALSATRDFHAMKARIADVAREISDRAAARYDAAEIAESVALLHWLLEDHFVILGYRGYDIRREDGEAVASVTPGSGLGILAESSRSRYAQPVKVDELPQRIRDLATDGPLLYVARTTRASTVHRQKRMTMISVQKVAEDGSLVGEHRIIGLLAQKAFVEPSSTVPLLRAKLQRILDLEDVVDHSHDERALRTLFDAFPKQELFEVDVEELRTTLVQLLERGDDTRTRVMLRSEPTERSVSALIGVPRDRFSATLRKQVQQLLVESTHALNVDYHLSMSERDEPLMHFTLHLDPLRPPPELDELTLHARISALTRTFADELAEALTPLRGADRAAETAHLWASALPSSYKERTDVDVVIDDVVAIESLDGPQSTRMRLLSRAGDAAGLLRFRLYKAGEGVELSSFLPLLESMGLVVVEEQPTRLENAPLWDQVHIHDYGVRTTETVIDVETDGRRIAEAARAMWEGRAAVDTLNRLVLVAGLDVRQVSLLRAYRKYIRQVGTTYTESTINDTLVEHPDVARALLGYFEQRFDPAHEHGVDSDIVGETALRSDVLAALEHVERLDQDRILRGFLGMIDATLRTNMWRGRPWLSFKFASAEVPGVPKPVPHREVFVYSPSMEGIHLRGGPVARGGLRWSDRLDDFRTEVLGLMKAQVTKNAVIVPTGSKGGFVLKRRPADPLALRAEVEAQYRVFISGLLDITDNVVDGVVVPPADVVRRDGDDPYLVVAADRGTATFSDIANGIARDYGFWLDDAFASGGSQGYDHKAMGITARGAWVAVQRHFRELSIDVQSDPITVVGIGDMSGDVFGNGMLRSRAIRLVAAFDHRDVFIDPHPDADRSFDERLRLYHTPRSSWQDYDRALISEGGGVWSRTAKAVPLSPQAREVLRIDAPQLSPPELLHAILKAPVDLIWFGGIGTYIKARTENNADVGDRANDVIRVDADEVAARVLGEGGNLAVTQPGRIAYARRGGRCNTDAIDNQAGVNTSDREVNLKILLSVAIAAGTLPAERRDELLESLTVDVADQVLRDAYLQTWAISQELAHSPGGIGAYEQLMADLESRGRLDRVVEVLPSTAQIDQRRTAGAGLTRPELAVLLAYAKIDVAEQLLASDVVDQPVFESVLRGYFPGETSRRFADEAGRHRLRRDLIATVVANDVCNRLGITWAMRSASDLGVDVATTVAAYWGARQVVGADALWSALERLDLRADPLLQLELKTEIDLLVDAVSRSFVRQARTDDIATVIAEDRPAFVELSARAGVGGSQAQRLARRRRADRWIDLGIEEDLAERIAVLPDLALAPGITATARASGRSVPDCAEVYAQVADRLPLDAMAARLREFDPHGRWERWQHRGLVDDLRRLHHTLARQAVAAGSDGAPPATVVAAYLDARDEVVERAVGLARQVQVQPAGDLNALAVAVRALSEIAG